MHNPLIENEKIKLIGQGYDGSELLTLYEKLKPNVVIIDIQMSSHGNGVLAIMNLMEKYPEAARSEFAVRKYKDSRLRIIKTVLEE